ncbi:MAG TPA: adenylate/guanylate cyclase domain-containing protein [Gaiellaceae bacterium]|nr:adenylate/guanylate cyclase domain-containing protein [Gaiellaceae bacterium]
MAQVLDDPLAAGRDAVRRYAWHEAFEQLTAADSADGGLGPEDLESLAASAWWTGRLDACIAARERAYAGHLETGNPRAAAMVAMALAKDYYAKRAAAIGSAWVSRADRLLRDEPESVERGWLERLHGVIALEGMGDFDKAFTHAERVYEIATTFGDRELQAIGLHDQGRALVGKGRVDEGMALIDEATVAAVSGELSPLSTGVIYCNTITACEELADYRRAGDWTEAAKRWCERQAIAGFPGMCRVYRASIMRLRGAWGEAEQEARRASDELLDFNVAYAAEAFYEIGEVRLRMGDVAAAEEAFTQAHELGRDPQPGLALLRLAQQNVEGAASCIESALDDESRDLHRARLLPVDVSGALAAGDLERARAAATELEEIAHTYGTDALRAASSGARSALKLAEGDAAEAIRAAKRALSLWQSVDAPYEAAQARMLLAAAFAGRGNSENAVRELRSAASAFDRLGAALDAGRARERLEALGADAATQRGDGRATRTFLFTDIVRSTNLVEAIGDDAWGDLVRWHDQTLRGLFAAHQGEEVDHAGDGFFVAFANSSVAVECAVAIQRKLAEHRREQGFAPQVRIGIHSAEASRQGAGYKGRGVHEAARISALADGGEIVASAETVAAKKPRFPVSEPRQVNLKGIEAPVEVVSIDWR